MSLSSKLIGGTKPEPETIAEIQSVMGVPEGRPIALMVLEVTFKTKKIYCCLSGGYVQDGEPHLTLIGRAALEALINLPMGDQQSLILQEVAIGQTPLRNKVREAVMRAPDGAKLCFIGDMQGDLDGKMLPALNWSGGVVDIAH
ncbi:hypothetical protein [Dyella acidisoli]|uniref:Uncharacterized protein n=1 Tax=Dyella acidisoli TaxID=1867834 RepID=A0ABQ5XWW7_9GAMM|nr:hypothetical protein [Dyella acidisoli]GLQ95252.1 hypothetical protein GCM10007901_42070 [Dyella acidisoli]